MWKLDETSAILSISPILQARIGGPVGCDGPRRGAEPDVAAVGRVPVNGQPRGEEDAGKDGQPR